MLEPNGWMTDDYTIYDDSSSQHTLIANSTQMPIGEQLNIRTDFIASIDSRKSPRSQMIEMAAELNLQKEENIHLFQEVNNLKLKYEPLVKRLSHENAELKNEISYTKKLIKELRDEPSSSSSSQQMQTKLDELKSELKDTQEKCASLQNKNTQLSTENERLKQYESIVKALQLVDVNNKSYQLLSKIGQGGFSVVYHCVSVKEHKSYALKRVDLSALDTENIKSILNEIELLKKLQSTKKVVELIDQ